MIYLGREKLFGFSVGFGDTLFWQPWQFPWPGWSVSLPVLPCWGHLAGGSSEVAPGGGGQSKVWLPWPGWAVPELGPAAQTSWGKPRRALAVPGWHRGTARAGGSRAVQVLSCQPHPQGCQTLWLSAASPAALEVSGAFSRAAPGLLILNGSWPCVPVGFPTHQSPSGAFCPLHSPEPSPWHLPGHWALLRWASPAPSSLPTDLPVENLFPARLQWLSSLAGVCRAQCVAQWLSHCLSEPLSLPCGEAQGCPSRMQDSAAASISDHCWALLLPLHWRAGLYAENATTATKNPTLYIENAQMIH